MTSVAPIERLDSPRYEQARVAVGRAFCDYPLMVYVAPEVARRAPAVTTLYGAILWDAFRWGEVHVTPDVVGVCAWLPPEKSVPTFWRQVRSGMLALPFDFGWRAFRTLSLYGDAAAKLHHDYAPMPHYYLAAIGVVPQRQGQGIGSAVMQPMLGRADDQKVHCWLDTHKEENVRLYQRHGFEVSQKVDLAGHPVPVWGMLRRPR
ncbi:MAG: GNAT family N-acetyltransferase [Pirellulales bacterium]